MHLQQVKRDIQTRKKNTAGLWFYPLRFVWIVELTYQTEPHAKKREREGGKNKHGAGERKVFSGEKFPQYWFNPSKNVSAY